MFFNYKKELSDIWKRHIEEAEILRNAGISEADIKELLAFEVSQLYRDRCFYGLLERYIDADFDSLVAVPFSSRFDIMDEIDDPKLYYALSQLTALERRIVLLHVTESFSLREVAAELGFTYDSIKKKYFRAIQKIKNFMKNCPR